MKSIRDVMVTNFVSVEPQTSIFQAVRTMQKEKTGSMLVIDDENLVGIFTERDLIHKFLPKLEALDPNEMKICNFMTKEITTASPELLTSEIINLMKEKHIRHMPVIEEGKIIGVVSLRGLMWHYQEELEKQIQEKNEAYASLEKAHQSLKELQMQLVHAARIAAMGEMAAGVVHELNQPLMAITTHLETLAMHETINADDRLKAKFKKIKEQFSRLKTIVQRLSNFSKKHTEEKCEENINTPISDSIFLFEQQFKDHNIDLDIDLADDLPKLYFDKYQIQDIVINFLVNARDAIDDVFHCDPGGSLLMFSKLMPDLNTIVVGVIDNGKPVTEGTEKEIFNTFFTTKDESKGTGLGLSVCKNIIKNHNGLLNFVTLKDDKKIFYFALPTEKEAILDESSQMGPLEEHLKSSYNFL